MDRSTAAQVFNQPSHFDQDRLPEAIEKALLGVAHSTGLLNPNILQRFLIHGDPARSFGAMVSNLGGMLNVEALNCVLPPHSPPTRHRLGPAATWLSWPLSLLFPTHANAAPHRGDA